MLFFKHDKSRSSYKKYLPETVKIHTADISELRRENITLKENVNDLIDKYNRLIDCVKLLDKKNTLLADCFQLEFKGNSFRKKRK